MTTGERSRTSRAASTALADKHGITLVVNGERYDLEIGAQPDRVRPADTLAHTLRENLGLTGTKIGCDHGACGACTVIMDGRPVLSCMTLTVECDGRNITTIEGLEDLKTGRLHPLQQAFVDNTAFQCGFCTPGMILSSKALLDANPSPTEDDIKEALAGNFCRCGSWYLVIKAIKEAAARAV
ncbi:MAG: (2Fe-2S)-binding protein [Chloroflexi bacterium]|nr:(2Fe-2S)-binding protein [Chloroflexota bacterium]